MARRLRLEVLAFILIFLSDFALAIDRICHACSGISCQRTTNLQTVACANVLDSCVSVYEGPLTIMQGCYAEVPDHLRRQCQVPEVAALTPFSNFGCHICSENFCNNLAPSDITCLQCDSKSDSICKTSPETLTPTRCGNVQAYNAYCFARSDDEEHLTRGCSVTQSEQRACAGDDNCMLCMPVELSGDCNGMEITKIDDNNNNGGGDHGDTGNNNNTDNGNNGGNGSPGEGDTDNGNSNGNNTNGENGGNTNNGGGNNTNNGNGDGPNNGGSENNNGTDTGGSGNNNTNNGGGNDSSNNNGGSVNNGTDIDNNGGESNSTNGTESGGNGNGEDPGNATAKIIIHLSAFLVAVVCILLVHI